MASPTLDWERVGDSFYRKVKLYEAVFDQDLELENYVVAGAPYGGIIGMDAALSNFINTYLPFLALYRDEDKLHTYRGNQSSKTSIDLYSCSGKLIRQINVGNALTSEFLYESD